MKQNNNVPKIVTYICNLINLKSKDKVFISYKKTSHPLSTGWLIKNKTETIDSCIFYSSLSLDFYFYSIENNEIYTYQEKDGFKNQQRVDEKLSL